MTNPRPHAELAARYFADDTMKCWTRGNNSKQWWPNHTPDFSANLEYHVGHEPPPITRTITLTVNGRKWVLPEPLREHPNEGATYWSADWMGQLWFARWADDRQEIQALEQGNCFGSEADAQAWAEFYKWCRGGGV